MLHKVTKIEKINPYSLLLSFDNNESKTVDIQAFINNKFHGRLSENSPYMQILNKDYFSNVKYRAEDGTIYWDNGIDFCPETLRSIGK